MPNGDKKPRLSKQPIGDPPARKHPARGDRSDGTKKAEPPMMDPFTEQTTHPAGTGQGANAPQPKPADQRKTSKDDADEETMPIEEGFSPVP